MCSDGCGKSCRLQPRQRASRTATVRSGTRRPSRRPLAAGRASARSHPTSPADQQDDGRSAGKRRDELGVGHLRHRPSPPLSILNGRGLSARSAAASPAHAAPRSSTVTSSVPASARAAAAAPRRDRLLLRRALPRRAGRSGDASWSRCWRRSADSPPRRRPTAIRPSRCACGSRASGRSNSRSPRDPGAWLEARARVAGTTRAAVQDRGGRHR